MVQGLIWNIHIGRSFVNKLAPSSRQVSLQTYSNLHHVYVRRSKVEDNTILQFLCFLKRILRQLCDF
jgi:hypothetical protein